MANLTYDWQPRMPEISRLYLEGKSVLEIHIAIQDHEAGFTPKPRRVYDVLNENGYPTKPRERRIFMKHRLGRGPNTSSGSEYHREDTHPPALLSSDRFQSTSAVPSASTEPTTQSSTSFLDRLQYDRDSTTAYGDQPYQDQDLPRGYEQKQDLDPVQIPNWLYNIETPTAGIMENNVQPGTRSDQYSGQDQVTPGASTSSYLDPVPTGAVQVDSTCNSPDTASLVISQGNFSTVQTLKPDDFPSFPLSGPSLHRSSSKARRVSCTNPNALIRSTSLLSSRRGFRWSSSSEKWASNSARDSGYSSGRNSPFPLAIEEMPTNEESLREFHALYRAPCILHEPRPATSTSFFSRRTLKDQYKDVATCPTCLYSAIHNLSWSAMHLKLEVFQSELKLSGTYDITAVDIVGNTALHYAAAGGAGSDYLISLMEAGVSPYHMNTEGQLFLHCLSPKDATGTVSLPMLIINLINTLNYLNYMNSAATLASLRWRDNEGRTFLDALAMIVPPGDIQELIRSVNDAGYPVQLSTKFTNSCDENWLDKEFLTIQDKQRKAYEVLGHALSDRPNYVDPETGDNVLHALAKLLLPEKGSLLQKIAECVSKDDVDLNLYNRDRHCPLAAFIQERPCLGHDSEETGATLSKYLDALLWKDSRNRISNRINVNMRNRAGATALYYAAIRARPDSVRSLIEAGANVNAKIVVKGHSQSVLQATLNARSAYVNDHVKMHLYNEVISYLQHAEAETDPTIFQERGLCANSVRMIPL